MNKSTPEYHVIDVILVFISIIITEIGSCLTSQNSKRFIQSLGNNALHLTNTETTKAGKVKNLSQSQSTRLSKDMEDQKKVVGTGTRVSQKKPTASSTRSKQSKPFSKSVKNTRSGTKTASASHLQTTTGKSVLLPLQQSTILKNDHTTADEVSNHKD